ncbi:FAD-dependent monooxygenase OpS4 [Exophiala dermatitidis]|uniref:Salicylate hydroxylase n=1 Tax=Exophiala dermatitidis (strain ATCC 34100 / CBS 525.76 / NIH/UT8656) TaxID=858893 RepID=H6C990_EXODN|nr:salicylate hydroxylase [Exophiala dermatitidis NIH/UT8656]EHY60667.1 salicylate hydroxylase [Exophiala dermatitidis NIH/UT8656]
MPQKKLHVGICGGGLGGLTAAIAIARTGAKVTLLEAAKELGEIGAGIQVFPNVSRLLIRWGVDELIGRNLILVDEINTWSADNQLIARFDPKLGAKQAGFPHWLVRRDHLHAGLTEFARRHGVEMKVGSRVDTLEYSEDTVKVRTTSGVEHSFDLLVGSDGIKSTIRRTLFPDVVPQAASTVAAFRGILSYEEVFAQVPEARQLLRNTMDGWIGPNGYILLYPLSAGTELNVVTLFQMDHIVKVPEVMEIGEFRQLYKDWNPVARKILELVNYTQKWPLLVLPPMKTWSNEHKNVVLLGDAAHCMQNHMAQGAATAMEDGAFLGTVIGEVVRGTISLSEAIGLYEKKRIPRAWTKQQASFVSGTINMAVGEEAERRNRASAPEVKAWDRNIIYPSDLLPPTYRSWQMYCTPTSVPGILYYDPEGDADNAVCEYLQSKTEMDPTTLVTKGLWDKWWGVIDDNGLGGFEGDINGVKSQ